MDSKLQVKDSGKFLIKYIMMISLSWVIDYQSIVQPLYGWNTADMA